jgi:hypothetical protein
MRTDEWLYENAVLPIYRRMYKEATPSADFDTLMKNGKTKEPGWFMKYQLSMDRQITIIGEVCSGIHATKREFVKIQTTVILGCSPSSSDFVKIR